MLFLHVLDTLRCGKRPKARCSKAFKRLKGITNLMAVLGSNEFKSSFREVAKKVNKLKLDQLMKETEKNSTALLDNITKLNFLIRNL